MSFNIGIVGNGFVGSAIVAGFTLSVKEVRIYDTNSNRATHSLQDTVNSDFIFVGVPTPMNSFDGALDLSIMDRVLQEINENNKRQDNIVIIKSTVVPGTVEKYIEAYPNLNIVYNPEFLTERAARLDFINSSRIVIGGTPENLQKVKSLYRLRFPYKTIVETDITTAQFIKYMANCFFAVKIAFMNEMKQGADAMNVDWDSAMRGFTLDGRIGNSHLDVPGHDGLRGFGGKCFPKDINAFMNTFKEVGVYPAIMKAAWDKNLEVREEKDWEKIKWATSAEEK
tara:strand:+ start:1952 stop:2800 length:849 start_codon:yes stop_codon:yes gene_type:complete